MWGEWGESVQNENVQSVTLERIKFQLNKIIDKQMIDDMVGVKLEKFIEDQGQEFVLRLRATVLEGELEAEENFVSDLSGL